MAYLQSVVPHPTDSNKLRLTFSAALDTSTVLAANFTLSPAVTTQWAAIVSGSGNTQVDLHFGTDLPDDPGDIVALWRFNEPSGTTAADEGPGGYTLTDQGSATIVDNGLFGRARSLSGATGSSLQSAFTTAPRTAVLGEWTIDALIRWDSSQADAVGDVFGFCGLSASATQAENMLVGLGFGTLGNNWVFWENGAGVGNTTAATPNGTIKGSLLTLVTVTKTLSGSQYFCTIWVNGKAISNGHPFNNADGGNSGSMRWSVGCPANGTGTNRFKGVVDTIRMSSFVRTDIASYADALLYPLTRGTTYTLTCSGVLDSLAAPITGDSAVYTFTYLGATTIESTLPGLTLTSQRTGTDTIRVKATNALASLAATTVPGNWGISGPSAVTVSSVSFTPGNDYLVLNTSGTYIGGTYTVTPAWQTVKDAYGQYWGGSLSVAVQSGGGGSSGFNSDLN